GYRDAYPDDGAPLFLAPGLVVARELEAVGERAAIYDDFVSVDDARDLQRWVASFLQAWGTDAAGHYITGYRGVSVARAARYVLGERITDELRRTLALRSALTAHEGAE